MKWRTVGVDVLVLQQSTILYFVGFGFAKLFKPWVANADVILLQVALAIQIFSNLFLSRERAIQISHSGRPSGIVRHVTYRVLALCGFGVVIGVAFPQYISFVWAVTPLTCLVLAAVALHSAGQVRIESSRVAIFTLPLSVAVGFAVPLIAISAWWAGTFYWGLLGVALWVARREAPDGARIEVLERRTAGRRVKRISLWLASAATAEYDRYLLGYKRNAGEGATFGALTSIAMIPLVLLSSIGPRFALKRGDAGQSRRVILAILGFELALSAVSLVLLPLEVGLLFSAGAFKIACHAWSAKAYFGIMARDANVSGLLSVLVSGVTLISTGALFFNAFLLAALAKVAAGLLMLWLCSVFSARLSDG